MRGSSFRNAEMAFMRSELEGPLSLQISAPPGLDSCDDRTAETCPYGGCPDSWFDEGWECQICRPQLARQPAVPWW